MNRREETAVKEMDWRREIEMNRRKVLGYQKGNPTGSITARARQNAELFSQSEGSISYVDEGVDDAFMDDSNDCGLTIHIPEEEEEENGERNDEKTEILENGPFNKGEENKKRKDEITDMLEKRCRTIMQDNESDKVDDQMTKMFEKRTVEEDEEKQEDSKQCKTLGKRAGVLCGYGVTAVTDTRKHLTRDSTSSENSVVQNSIAKKNCSAENFHSPTNPQHRASLFESLLGKAHDHIIDKQVPPSETKGSNFERNEAKSVDTLKDLSYRITELRRKVKHQKLIKNLNLLAKKCKISENDQQLQNPSDISNSSGVANISDLEIHDLSSEVEFNQAKSSASYSKSSAKKIRALNTNNSQAEAMNTSAEEIAKFNESSTDNSREIANQSSDNPCEFFNHSQEESQNSDDKLIRDAKLGASKKYLRVEIEPLKDFDTKLHKPKDPRCLQCTHCGRWIVNVVRHMQRFHGMSRKEAHEATEEVMKRHGKQDKWTNQSTKAGAVWTQSKQNLQEKQSLDQNNNEELNSGDRTHEIPQEACKGRSKYKEKQGMVYFLKGARENDAKGKKRQQDSQGNVCQNLGTQDSTGIINYNEPSGLDKNSRGKTVDSVGHGKPNEVTCQRKGITGNRKAVPAARGKSDTKILSGTRESQGPVGVKRVHDARLAANIKQYRDLTEPGELSEVQNGGEFRNEEWYHCPLCHLMVSNDRESSHDCTDACASSSSRECSICNSQCNSGK